MRAGDTYVLLASLPYLDGNSPDAAVWWSGDGAKWQLGKEFPAGTSILALTAGGPGFVVGGFNDNDAAVWTSTDGRTWQPQDDSSLAKGVIAQLITTDSGLVGFGWRSDNDARALLDLGGRLSSGSPRPTRRVMTVAKGLEAVAFLRRSRDRVRLGRRRQAAGDLGDDRSRGMDPYRRPRGRRHRRPGGGR